MNKIIWVIIGLCIFIGGVYAGSLLSNLQSSIIKLPPDSQIRLESTHSIYDSNKESILLYGLTPEAKSYIAWETYDANLKKIKPSAWIGAHYNSSSGNGVHSHWSIETLDNETGTPSINTKFEINYGSNNTRANGGSYAQFSSLDRVIFSKADIVLSGSNSDILGTSEIDLYPNNQMNRGIKLQTLEDTIQLSVTGDNNLLIGDDITIQTLKGNGNAYACLDLAGKLFRSITPCK